MGEIKSTLDLVMERTRHLSLSEKEKEKQQLEAFQKRLQGILQQVEDGALTYDELLERLKILQADTGIEDHQEVVAAVASRLDPDQDNDFWLRLLEVLVPETVTKLREALKMHQQKMADQLQNASQEFQDRLARHYHIEGSAVEPNPLKNSSCRETIDTLKKETRAKIDGILGQGERSA